MEENQSAAVKNKISTPRQMANEIYDWAECIIFALVSVIIILTFTMRITVVDGDSMLPTLVNKQYLIISHLFYEPTYNDIVVLQAKNMVNEDYEYGKPIVKRVIGLEGDEIRIDFDNGIVYRNETALTLEEKDGNIFEEGHLINDYTYLREDMNGSVVVPEGYIFVLGDNRNNSKDSRSSDVGLVDTRYIVGKAYFRIMPADKFGALS